MAMGPTDGGSLSLILGITKIAIEIAVSFLATGGKLVMILALLPCAISALGHPAHITGAPAPEEGATIHDTLLYTTFLFEIILSMKFKFEYLKYEIQIT
jgi:hypothetical protein